MESLRERLVRGDVGGRFGELSDHRTGAFRLFRERLRHRLGGDDAHVVPGVVEHRERSVTRQAQQVGGVRQHRGRGQG